MNLARHHLGWRLPAICLLPVAAICCVLIGGCSGAGGLGAGTATLSLTVSQLPGTGFLAPSSVSTRALGFDEALVGGGDVLQGVAIRLLKQGGQLDVEARTNQEEGRVLIGALAADTYFLTVRGTTPDEAISFPLLVERPSSIVMRARLERDQTVLLLNAQAITDANNDSQSDDGYRLTIVGQRPSGGGTLIIHHSHGQNVPPQDADLRIRATLDPSGAYSILEQFVDTDDDGLANDSPLEDDIDGDGIPDAEDTDVDGDNIANPQDTDVDGDHLPNSQDDDDDGDGIPDAEDPTPQGPAPTS